MSKQYLEASTTTATSSSQAATKTIRKTKNKYLLDMGLYLNAYNLSMCGSNIQINQTTAKFSGTINQLEVKIKPKFLNKINSFPSKRIDT